MPWPTPHSHPQGGCFPPHPRQRFHPRPPHRRPPDRPAAGSPHSADSSFPGDRRYPRPRSSPPPQAPHDPPWKTQPPRGPSSPADSTASESTTNAFLGLYACVRFDSTPERRPSSPHGGGTRPGAISLATQIRPKCDPKRTRLDPSAKTRICTASPPRRSSARPRLRPLREVAAPPQARPTRRLPTDRSRRTPASAARLAVPPPSNCRSSRGT